MVYRIFECCEKEKRIMWTRISESNLVTEMNQYPVVFLSFLNVKASSDEGMLYQLRAALRGEYVRYYAIINDVTLPDVQKNQPSSNYIDDL